MRIIIMIAINQVQTANDYAQKVEKTKNKAVKILDKYFQENETTILLVQAYNRLVNGRGLNSTMIKAILPVIQKVNPIPSSKMDQVIAMLSIDQPSFYNDYGQAFKD